MVQQEYQIWNNVTTCIVWYILLLILHAGSKSKYAIPKIELLEDFPGVDGNTFNVLAKIGADYFKFAIHLLQDDDSFNIVRGLEKQYGNISGDINRAIAAKWLEKGRDKSWKFLISVLKIIDKGTAAEDLTQALKIKGVSVEAIW